MVALKTIENLRTQFNRKVKLKSVEKNLKAKKFNMVVRCNKKGHF